MDTEESTHLFQDQGELLTGEASTRFLMHDTTSFYSIESGNVDLFAFHPAMEDGNFIQQQSSQSTPFKFNLLASQLTFIGQVEVGQLLFPFPMPPKGQDGFFCIIATTPLKMRKLPLSLLENRLDEDFILLQRVIIAVQTWVNTLFAFFQSPYAPPISRQDAQAIRSLDKRKLFIPSELAEEILRYNRSFQSLFVSESHKAFQHKLQAFSLEESDEKTLLENALNKSSKILVDKGYLPQISTSHQLLNTLRVIGNYLEINFFLPPWYKPQGQIANEVYEICRFSHVFYRQIRLRKNWWKRSFEPLLCFQQEGTPVALIPQEKGGYSLVDPITQKVHPLHAHLAAALQEQAFVIYRSFPEEKEPTFSNIMRFYLFRQSGSVQKIIFLSLLTLGLTQFIPLAAKILFNQVIMHLDNYMLLQIGMGLLIVTISTLLFQLAREFLLVKFMTAMNANACAAFLHRLFSLPLNHFRHTQNEETFKNILSSGTIRHALITPLRTLLDGAFGSLYLLSMFYYSPFLASIILAGTTLLTAGASYMAFRGYKIQAALMQAKDLCYGKVMETVNAFSKVRSTGTEKRFFVFWQDLYYSYKVLEKKMRHDQIFFKSAVFSFTNLLFFLIFIIFNGLLNQTISNKSTASFGDFMAFLTALLPFTWIVCTSVLNLMKFGEMQQFWNKAAHLFHTPVQTHIEEKLHLSTLKGEIKIENLSFKYAESNQYAIQDVNIIVHPGEFVAIMGPSGSGKSTLLRVMLGLDTAEVGDVFYDRHSIKSVYLEEIWRQLGLVLHQNALLNGTIRENIVGSRIYSDEEIMQAARFSGFDEELAHFSQGLDTMVINGGSNFSEGEKQLIFITRAIISHPHILILDEPTNGLDNRSRALFTQNLGAMNATRVVVTHSLSLAREADRIYVIEKGQIIKSGTFDEVI